MCRKTNLRRCGVARGSPDRTGKAAVPIQPVSQSGITPAARSPLSRLVHWTVAAVVATVASMVPQTQRTAVAVASQCSRHLLAARAPRAQRRSPSSVVRCAEDGLPARRIVLPRNASMSDSSWPLGSYTPGQPTTAVTRHDHHPGWDRPARHVRWMFARRLAGRSLAVIARELNERGVPCPSGVDRVRNPHRSGVEWTLGPLQARGPPWPWCRAGCHFGTFGGATPAGRPRRSVWAPAQRRWRCPSRVSPVVPRGRSPARARVRRCRR